jgi:hypothetical protein
VDGFSLRLLPFIIIVNKLVNKVYQRPEHLQFIRRRTERNRVRATWIAATGARIHRRAFVFVP